MTPMTNRQRLLGVIQQRPIDRVPFVQYSGLAGPDEEIWSLVGRDSLGLIRWSAVHRVEHPNCRFETEEFQLAGRKAVRTTLHTPAGSLQQVRVQEPTFLTTSAREHFVKEPRDYQVLLAYLRDAVVSEDLATYLRHDRELGQDGLPMVSVGRTPYQQLWIEWVSLEDLALHLVDQPDVLEEVTSTLAALQRRVFQVVRLAAGKIAIPFVDVPDNITAPAVGEAYFRRFCLPQYRHLAELLADVNIPVFVHMDGYLRPLWRAIGESGVRGLDSLSPPPDNDTRPADAAAMWPEMRLFVNFPSSVHLAAPGRIYETAADLLHQAGHTRRLEIQVSENLPPGRWRVSFPAIIRAIADFGRP
jgi:hypothetical protein